MQLFQHAFEHAPIGMALVSPTGQWLRVNRSMCEILGYTEEELLASTFQEVTHPDDLAGDLEEVRRLLAGEADSFQLEKRYRHKQGHYVWGLLSVSLVRDAQGKPELFVSQVQDITARKAAEQMRDALFRLPVVMHWIVGFDGRFKRLSPSWEDVLGYKREELIGQQYIDFVHPEDREFTLAEAERVQQGRGTHLFENRYCHKDGNYRWLLWTSVANEEQQLIYGVALDYSPRKQTELQLSATLQEKEQLLERLQSSTAEIDELRQKLVTICAWTKRIRYNDRWMTTDEFLRNHLQLNLTHGISDEAAAEIFGTPLKKTGSD